MKSSMMEMTSTVWATKDVDIDFDAARAMEAVMMTIQPGMADLAEEMAKIDGFQVAMEGSMGIMGNSVETTGKTVSIGEGTPEGGYGPPKDYTKADFNPMSAMQQ